MVKQLSKDEPIDSRESVVGRERIGGRQRDREERSANEKSKLSEEVLRRRSKRGLSRYEGKKKDNNKAKMLKLQLKAGDLKKKAGKKVSKLKSNLAKSGLLKSFKAGYKGKKSSTKSKPDITSKSKVKKKSEVIKAKVKNKKPTNKDNVKKAYSSLGLTYQEGGMVNSSSVGSKINGMQMNSRRLLNMANKRRKDVRS